MFLYRYARTTPFWVGPHSLRVGGVEMIGSANRKLCSHGCLLGKVYRYKEPECAMRVNDTNDVGKLLEAT